jgi:hypothetical protein
MKRRFLSNLGITVGLVAGVAACSGPNTGPNVDQVKADFDNPSGSAKDQQGVAATAGAQDNLESTGGAGFTGGGVPGFSLRAEGLVQTGFAPLIPHNLFADQIAELQDLVLGKQSFDLSGMSGMGSGASPSGSIISQCVSSKDVQQKFASQLQGAASDLKKSGHASFDISTTVDFSNCPNSGYTGSFDIELKGDINERAPSASVTLEVSVNLHTACQTASGVCIDGGIAEEDVINGSATVLSPNAGGARSGSGSISYLVAWDFTATKDSQTITEKGGSRVSLSGANGMRDASVELLFYVANSERQLVSYVLKVSADSNGTVTLELRCKDGNLTCTKMADGSAMCMGMVDGQPYMQSWDAALYAGAKASGGSKK